VGVGSNQKQPASYGSIDYSRSPVVAWRPGLGRSLGRKEVKGDAFFPTTIEGPDFTIGSRGPRSGRVRPSAVGVL
jgi:hypothetical protein